MSILLDALRKSEAQRRLGEIPTLQTSVSVDDGHSAERQHWIPVALVLLSVAIMSWTGITQFRGADSVPATPTGGKERPPVVAEESAPENNSDIPGSIGRKGRSTSTRSRAPTPVQNYVDESPAAEKDAPSEAPSRQVAHVEVEKGASANARKPQPPANGSVKATTPSTQSQLAEAGAYAPQAINYWQMPQSLREEMGEFRISVMVYAETPSDRFLLLNGSRLREQQETDGGVRLEEIQRDRAIFSYRKYQFYVTN